MIRQLNLIWTCMISLVLVMSCSIKENRDDCPCLLFLKCADTDTSVVRTLDVKISSSEGVVWTDTLDVKRELEGYVVRVPRTGLHVRAWYGAGENVMGEEIIIPYGMECPKIYMHVSHIETSGETYRETLRVRKEHCVMTVLTEGEGTIPSEMRVVGNVCGYDASGLPMPGDFSYLLNEGGCQVVLPRQKDASMMLNLDDHAGNRKSFALGQYLVKSGYDWTAADLDDVTVTIDYALTEIRLHINGWESVYKYDIEI